MSLNLISGTSLLSLEEHFLIPNTKDVETINIFYSRYERQLAYINQEMENECVEMQEDAPEEFTNDCCGRYKLFQAKL